MRLIIKQSLVKKEWSTVFCVGDKACEKGGELSNSVLEKMKSQNLIQEVDGVQLIESFYQHAALTNEVQNCMYYEIVKIGIDQLNPPQGTPLPAPDPNILCDKCDHKGVPKGKFIFSDSRSRKRQMRWSGHCEKCDHELTFFKKYFTTPKHEQAEKDLLTAAGETWTEKPALVN